MKWVMATNAESLERPQFCELILAALSSARKNTTLEPFLLYEGNRSARLDSLQHLGVTVLETSLTIRRHILDFMRQRGDTPDYIHSRLGSWLRLELAPTLIRYGIPDRYVLYTDCDVIFLRDAPWDRIRPKTIAAVVDKVGGWSRFKLFALRHFNAGVLVLNIPAMLDSYKAFRALIINNAHGVCRPKHPFPFIQKHLFLSDQVALNLFYGKSASSLSRLYNWNPSRGISRRPYIIHFNGPKWNEIDNIKSGSLPDHLKDKYARMYYMHNASYDYYSDLARSYLMSATAL